MKIVVSQSLDQDSVTLLGEITQLIGVSQVDTFFEYGEVDQGFPNSTPVTTISSEGSFSENVTGLNAGTQYEFRAVVQGGGISERSEIKTFITKKLEVEANSTTDVGPLSVTLEGEITTTIEISEDVDVGFEVREKKPGATTFLISAGTQQGTGSFSGEATGLKTNTTYEFQATAETSDILKKSSTQEFTTLPPQISVETGAAENVTKTSATIKGELLDFVTETDQASVFLQWGQSVNVNLTTAQTVSQPTEYDVEISNLIQGTTYEYQAVAEFDQTQKTGRVKTFTTRILSVETLAATNIQQTKASLNGEIIKFAQFDSAATVFFDWGKKGNGLPNTFELDSKFSSPQMFQITLQQLTSNTTYEFQARAKSEGATKTGQVLEFTTL